MESKKNTAPKGVLIALGLLVLMIVVYMVLTFVFPDVFRDLLDGVGGK